MKNIYKTISAALVDLNTNKQDLISEDNKLSKDYIEGLDNLSIDHKHIVKYDLIGVNSSASVTEVNHGDGYSTTLTASEEVIITVGGIDCTEDFYNPKTGVVQIDYVSGNINIYATNISKVDLFYINKYITGSVYMSNRDTQVISGDPYSSTMVVNDGYQLDSITIMMGSEDITGTAWDSVNGVISIGEVTDNVFITINSSLLGYSVTYNLTNATASIVVSKVTHNNSFSCTILPNAGHTLSQCYYSMGGSEFEAADGNINIEAVTGDLVITASAETIKYNITYNLTNSNVTNRIIEAEYGSNIILNYTVDPGYDPENPGVTVLGAEFSVGTEGRIIMINNILANVTVTINPSIIVYKISYLLSNCTVSSMDDRSRYYGESFQTLITPSDGYIIEDVTITMGSDDISSTSVTTNSSGTVTVNITSTTGDITIIAQGVTNTALVFNMLNNVTTDNTNTVVDRHSVYAANLSYDSTGYKGITVQVTMDGIDITSTAVTGDAIYIGDVTGNIAIIASAVSYTYYNFTYNLDGISLDYTPSSIREDGTYRSNYITTVVNPYIVTKLIMNGEDLTSSCVNSTSKVITISELTGDVVITLTANHTILPLSLSVFDAMNPDDTKTVLIGNPSTTSGYFLGHNGTSPVSYGAGFESFAHINATAYNLLGLSDYKFKITKHQDTENGEYYTLVQRNFTISGKFNNVSFSEDSFPLDGWDLYKVSNTTLPYLTRTSNVTITFDGETLPQTIYVKVYQSNSSSTLNVYPISGGAGVITPTTSNTVNTLDDFDEVTMTSNTLVLNTLCLSTGLFSSDKGSVYILVPNNITETEVNTQVTLVGDPYFTLSSSTGGYTPSGLTTGLASWTTSNSSAKYTIVLGSSGYTGLVSDINSDSSLRIINANGYDLNAGSNISGLNHTSTSDSGSIWQIYEV